MQAFGWISEYHCKHSVDSTELPFSVLILLRNLSQQPTASTKVKVLRQFFAMFLPLRKQVTIGIQKTWTRNTEPQIGHAMAGRRRWPTEAMAPPAPLHPTPESSGSGLEHQEFDESFLQGVTTGKIWGVPILWQQLWYYWQLFCWNATSSRTCGV